MHRFIYAIGLTLFALPAQALEIRYNFTADLDRQLVGTPTTDTLTDDYAAFTTISGQFVFDDTPVLTYGPTLTQFTPPEITVDQFDMSLITRDAVHLFVKNGAPDSFITSLPAISTGSADQTFNALEIYGTDPTGGAFGGSSFPSLSELLSLETFELRLRSDIFSGGTVVGSDISAYAITSLTVDTPAVPLPATLPALLAGLGAFGMLRRRKT